MDEPTWVLIHMFMEMSQNSTLYHYLKQTKLSFFFLFTKTENRKAKQFLLGVCTSVWEDIRKGYRRENVMGILGTHVCK
jgi:hypothetical protein